MKYKFHTTNYCQKRLEELANEIYQEENQKESLDNIFNSNNVINKNLMSLIPFITEVADDIMSKPSFLNYNPEKLGKEINKSTKRLNKIKSLIPQKTPYAFDLGGFLCDLYDFESIGKIYIGIIAYHHYLKFLPNTKHFFYSISDSYLKAKKYYQQKHFNQISESEYNYDINWFNKKSEFYGLVHNSLSNMVEILSKYFEEIKTLLKLEEFFENSSAEKEISFIADDFLDKIRQLKSYLSNASYSPNTSGNYSNNFTEYLVNKIIEDSISLELPKESVISYINKIFPNWA